jgi:glycogen synthase
VFNYSRSTRRGNGFVFEDYDENGLYAAFENAYKLFQDKKHYKIARENAYDGAIDIADQGISWNKEFYRLFNRV